MPGGVAVLLSAMELARHYGVDRRTVTNWQGERVPCPAEREGVKWRFDSVAVAQWHAERAVRHARAEWERAVAGTAGGVTVAPGGAGLQGRMSLQTIRVRRMELETQLLSLKLAHEERRLIPADVHERRVSLLVERLAARCRGLTRFASDVRRAVSEADAVAVLERVSDALLTALRGVADELSADDGLDDSAGPRGPGESGSDAELDEDEAPATGRAGAPPRRARPVRRPAPTSA